MPRVLDRWTGGRVPVGVRWWITRSGEFRTGWPEPGLETTALSMGWVAQRDAVGVIEIPAPPIDLGVLELLEGRFPGRRWFAGDWSEAESYRLRHAA